jgi:hypothetical protein
MSLRSSGVSPTFRPARLLADEQRVQEWFDSLSDRDRRRHYNVAEIRAAVGMPTSRLHVVLYRLGWTRIRDRQFGIYLYGGPFIQWRRGDSEELDKIIREVMS